MTAKHRPEKSLFEQVIFDHHCDLHLWPFDLKI